MTKGLIVYTNGKDEHGNDICQACRLTKTMIESKRLPYTEIDISADHKSADLLRAAGHLELPVVVTGNDVWTGFRPDKIRGLHG
jgi:glutaredoxin-like protein NrdH